VVSCYAEQDPSSTSAKWRFSPVPLVVRVRDLPPTTVLALTVFGVPDDRGEDVIVGGATVPLFSRTGRLKAGRYRARLHPRVPARGDDAAAETPGTLSHAPYTRRDADDARTEPAVIAADAARGAAAAAAAAAAPDVAEARAAVAAADRALRRFARGDVPRVPWLDAAALPKVAAALAEALAVMHGAGDLWLSFALPPTDFPVIWAEEPPANAAAAAVARAAAIRPSAEAPLEYATKLVWFCDDVSAEDDPAAKRAEKLARAAGRGGWGGLGLGGGGAGGEAARTLAPDASERRALAAAVRAPPTRPPDAGARELLWRFRYALRSDPFALPKLLRCVDWADAAEASAAAALAAEWAPLPPAAALELLAPAFEAAPAARAHAVAALRAASDDEVAALLLQLVQALRHEPLPETATSSPPGGSGSMVPPGGLAAFLVERAAGNAALACTLHWYLVVEWEDPRFAPRAAALHAALLAAAGPGVAAALTAGSELVAQLALLTRELAPVRGHARKRDRLRALLGEAGLCAELARFPAPLPLPLDPAVRISGVLPASAAVFKSALAPLRLTFRVAAPEGGTASAQMPMQPPEMPLPPSPPSSESGDDPDEAASRDEHNAGDAASGASDASTSPSASTTPFNPAAVGIAAATAAMEGLEGLGRAAAAAAAAAAESLLPTDEPAAPGSPSGIGGATVTLIYKKGDDLRQDQLCVQMMALMDRLLKRESLDLRMTPYRVLATGTDSGMVEYVPSCTVAAVLSEHRSITRFLQTCAPDAAAPHGIRSDVFETYIRSCAGSCVATYLLGVGDRHLDNIMVTRDGRLFHIDFGYIMGRDPKMFPPPMKLCREMIEAMGGPGSAGYARFKTLACEAYNILRKSAPLFLVLMQLMASAGIPDVSTEPDKTLLKLEEKFALALDDEAAVAHFAALIEQSASALFEALKENAHRIAQYWR
jgi:phosphatidylinositol 3-kinase